MITAQLATSPGASGDAIQAVQLVRGASSGDRGGPSTNSRYSVPLFVGSVMISMVMMVLAIAWWRRRREDPTERAMRRLCGVLRLTRAERGLLRSLAAPRQGERRALHPAALLLSQSAFIRAAAESDRDGAPASVIAELHRKIFNASGA